MTLNAWMRDRGGVMLLAACKSKSTRDGEGGGGGGGSEEWLTLEIADPSNSQHSPGRGPSVMSGLACVAIPLGMHMQYLAWLNDRTNIEINSYLIPQ